MDCSPCSDADANTIDGITGVCIVDCSILGENYYEKNGNCSVCNNACKTCKDG